MKRNAKNRTCRFCGNVPEFLSGGGACLNCTRRIYGELAYELAHKSIARQTSHSKTRYPIITEIKGIMKRLKNGEI